MMSNNGIVCRWFDLFIFSSSCCSNPDPMADVLASHSESAGFNEPTTLLGNVKNENGVDIAECGIQWSGEVVPKDATSVGTSLLDKGLMQYGCPHYRRRCSIRAPCCNEVFDCRHCHNEAKKHELPRHQIKQVICTLCGTEQEVQQVCVNCGVCMAKYFCGSCKLFDDDISKKQYHCEGCGICRIGGQENFFHCYKCRCCYSMMLKDSHPCVEGAMHHDCPICFEYLFESRNDVTVMPCGHTIHGDCLKEMREHYYYACPLCSKSVCDMSKVWERFDIELASIPVPEAYQNKMVWILCNDCGRTSEVQFHSVAQKCPNCRSYNTRKTRG